MKCTAVPVTAKTMYKLRKAHRFPRNSLKINENERKENASAVYKNNSNPLNGLLSGFFTDGKIDNDKIIIIALIFILAKEGADLKLLIALGYILM